MNTKINICHEIYPEFGKFKQNLERNYPFPIDLAPYENPFVAKLWCIIIRFKAQNLPNREITHLIGVALPSRDVGS